MLGGNKQKTKFTNPFFNFPVTRKVTNHNMVFLLEAGESGRSCPSQVVEL